MSYYPAAPHDFQSICDTFGDPRPYLDAEGNPRDVWEAVTLEMIKLPAPLSIPWAPGRKATQIRVHTVLAHIFTDLFNELVRDGIWKHVTELGGTYSWRRMRGGSKLSTHCWGVAIDLNPTDNQLGTNGHMHPDVVARFKKYGFYWGGEWNRPDPMHFQYVKLSY